MENTLKLRDRIYGIEDARIEIAQNNDNIFLQVAVTAEVTDLWDEIDSIIFMLCDGGKKMMQGFSINDLNHIEIKPTHEDFANTYTVEADEMGDNTIVIDKITDDKYSIKWSGLCNPCITEGFTIDVSFEINCFAQLTDNRN